KDKGNVDGAIAEYREALHLKKDLPLARRNLGIALEVKGSIDLTVVRTDFARAADDYAKVIAVLPNDSRFWPRLWEAYFGSKQLDNARRHYTQAIEQKPDWAFGWIGRGMTFAELGEWDKAAADFSKAAGLKDAPVIVSYCQALLCLRAGDADGY